MRLLVVGGTGFIGRATVAAARSTGAEVHATYFSNPPSDEMVAWTQLDIRDHEATVRVVRRSAPDAIVNAAYRERGDDVWSTTVGGAGRVAEAAAEAGARLVHLSTDVIFDGTAGRPYREDDRPNPLTDYARAKVAAEGLVSHHGGALVVRTSLVLAGDGQPSRHEAAVLAELEQPTGMRFFVDEIRCPIQVDDLAAGLVDLAAGSHVGPLHFAGPEPISRADLARLIGTRHGFDIGELPEGRIADFGSPRPAEVVLDSSLATALLGWSPRPVTEFLG